LPCLFQETSKFWLNKQRVIWEFHSGVSKAYRTDVGHSNESPSAVPSNEMTVIRSAVWSLSIGNGQGYLRCQCWGMCLTKRCFCFKAGNLCNSACHPKLACKNKTD
jgi:hypothetical protein